MDAIGGTPASQGSSQHQNQSTTNNGPQVRARITVVCGECKRLKLKCDRKSPCGSCQKRDTVSRCIYSAAAAEKVDLHSLNNRVCALESQMAEINGPQHGPTHSGSQNQDQNSAQSHSNGHGQSHASGSSSTYLEKDDGPLIALGPNGSSVLVSGEDVTHLWLGVLNLSPIITTIPLSSAPVIKPEPSDTPAPPSTVSTSKPPALSLYYTNFPQANEAPQISPELIQFFHPPPPARPRIWAAACTVLAAHPEVLPFAAQYKGRVDAMFKWAETQGASGSVGGDKKAEAARILMNRPQSVASSRVVGQRPTVSFFAASAAVFAIGAQALGIVPNNAARLGKKSAGGPSNAKKSKTLSTGSPTPELRSTADASSPAALFALSEQASDLFERSCGGAYDIDYINALQLRALFMLRDSAKEGGTRMDGRLYPLIGKMVTVARMMGLSRDPTEGTGREVRWTAWEEEGRRRAWWGVFWWDLYISDSLGHPPLIADNSFTTRLPTNLDEAAFGPSSATVPEAKEDNHAAFYYTIKMRLAKLVKRTKTCLLREADAEPLSIDDAFASHTDVKHFLDDLPAPFHLEGSADISQRCELAMTAQRLILQIYLPFLRAPQADSAGRSHATLESVQAAHRIVHASRLLQDSSVESNAPAIEEYAFGQALFGAAVVCANAVIGDPDAIWAREGLADVKAAYEVLRTVGGAEAIKVMQTLLSKAEASLSGGGSVAGVKRKRGEVDEEPSEIPVGFCLPYAGPGVAIASETKKDEPNTTNGETPALDSRPSSSPDVERRPPSLEKGKNKPKKSSHPPHGVRKRAVAEGPPYMRDKLEGNITATPSSTGVSDTELRLPSTGPHSSNTSPGNQFAYPMTERETHAFEQPLSVDLMPQPPSEYSNYTTGQHGRSFNLDHTHHQTFSPTSIDPSRGGFQGPSSSPPSYDNSSNGQSPAGGGFMSNPSQSFMPQPMADSYSQPFVQNYRPHQHTPLGLQVDEMSSSVPRVPYEEVKPYGIAPQYQAYDQTQNRGWEQNHNTSGEQQQFWPQNGYYAS